MNAALSQTAIAGYAFVAVLGFIILRRSYRLTQGVPLTATRLVVLPVVYVLLYAVELASVSFVGVTTSIAPLTVASLATDAALVAVGVLVAYRYTLRNVEIYQAPGETAWSYRMNAVLPVVYVALFFARVAIETAVLGESPFVFPTAASVAALSPLALYSLALVDALWGLSTGFLVGRSAAAWHEWRTHLAGEPASGERALG